MSVQLAINPEGFRLSARVRVPPEVIEWFSAALGIFVVSRLVILALVYAGARALGIVSASLASPISLLLATGRVGDALEYLEVAQNGYWFDPILRKGTPIPFPLYPWLVRALSAIVPNVTVAGAVLSSLAAAISLVLVYRLVVLRFGRPDVAFRACLLVGLFPFSYLLSAADARSLVLLGALVALLAEARGRYWLATGAAVFASLAAPVGLLLWPALAVERVARWTRRGFARSDAGALVVGLGVTAGAYAWFLNRLSALSFPAPSPLMVLFGKPVALSLASAGLVSEGPSASRLLALTVILIVLALATLPRVARALGIAAAVYVAALVGFVLARLLAVGDPADSAATLTLAFPSVVVVAESVKSRAGAAIVVGVSALLVAGATATAVFAAASPPGEVIAARSFADTTLTNFHLSLARKDPTAAPPRDLYLGFDHAFVILGDQPPARRYQAGDTISIPYYLYVLEAPTHGYLVSLRLRDLAGHSVAQSDKVLWGSADASLDSTNASANRPEVEPGGYLRLNLALPLDPRLPVGVYTLHTEVFVLPSFARLSLQPVAGAPVDQVSYPNLVVARPADLGSEPSLVPPRPLRADSDAAVSLLGYDAQRDRQNIDVSLYWEATARLDRNYTVFVQALDSAGKVVAQSDSYPEEGRFPTSSLDPGNVIRDVHVLGPFSSTGDGTVRLIAGLYRLETMQRVAFHRPGEATTTDYLSLGTVELAASR